MSNRWRLGTAMTLGVFVGLFVGRLGSQDRAAVVPGMKVLLENARVRVQYHDVAVGETVPLHSHPSYVAYVLKPYKAKGGGCRAPWLTQQVSDKLSHRLVEWCHQAEKR